VNFLFATLVCIIVTATIIYLVYRYQCGDLKGRDENEATSEQFISNSNIKFLVADFY